VSPVTKKYRIFKTTTSPTLYPQCVKYEVSGEGYETLETKLELLTYDDELGKILECGDIVEVSFTRVAKTTDFFSRGE
jgi:hypothetical protein